MSRIYLRRLNLKMKNNIQPKIRISLSREHNKYQSDVADAFKGVDVSFDAGLMRFSAEEMVMQIILNFGIGIASSAMWDAIKIGIKKLHNKFKTARITLRDSDSIMYTVKPDLTVTILVVPDKMKEFQHIKTLDDLIIYLKSKSDHVINDDWQLMPVSDIFTFIKSYAFSRDNLSNGILSSNNIGNIHYGDIHAKFTSENIDLSKVEIPLIKEAKFNPRKEELLKDGDLIMADASEDYDGVGVTVSVHGIGNNKVVGGLHTFVLRDEKGKTSEYYRQYIFLNKEIRNKLQKVANGVSVYGISKTAISKIELPIPPITEQKRIVSVLETWDKSIEKLTHKIETKKQIKKALMWDLLSGQKRLSGFKDKWERKTLEELAGGKANIVDGPFGSNLKNSDYIETGIPVLQGMNITGDKFNRKGFRYIGEKKVKEVYRSNAQVGDLLTVKIGSIGFTAIIDDIGPYDFAIIPANLLRFRCSNPLTDIRFIFYLLTNDSGKRKLRDIASGNAQPAISVVGFRKISFIVPTNKGEQKAISEILTIADKEITELEKKLAILKEQKRYLLNNLVTGKIRTPETLSTKS